MIQPAWHGSCLPILPWGRRLQWSGSSATANQCFLIYDLECENSLCADLSHVRGATPYGSPDSWDLFTVDNFNDVYPFENGVWDVGEVIFDWGNDGIENSGDAGEGDGFINIVDFNKFNFLYFIICCLNYI